MITVTGMSASCLWALGNLGETATTTEVRLWLEAQGEKLSPPQVRSTLHRLTYRKPPLAALVQQGRASHGGAFPGVWRLTEHGRAILAETRT